MINWPTQRVLLVSAHRDDVEIGAGGTMHRMDKCGTLIKHVSFSDPPGVNVDEFDKEHRQSVGILMPSMEGNEFLEYDGDPRNLHERRTIILDVLYQLNLSYKPTMVMCPCSTDVHQSHQVIHEECLRAFKYCTILGYEMPWNSFEFTPGLFSVLTKEDHNAKLAAIACYKTQQGRMFFSNGVVGDLMRVRGKQINREYAEAFEVVRMVV